MKQLILLALSLVLFQPAAHVLAQDELPFHFSKVTVKQLTAAQLEAAEKRHSEGVVDSANNTLKFSQNQVRLVVRTGPEDDMLSYRIQGLRNPTIVVPEMTTVKILFVNVDEDMSHDFLLGDIKPPFKSRPDASKSAGSEHLLPVSNKMFNTQEFSYHLHGKSILHYFCSVGSHAKNGMWGAMVVGDQPIPAAEKMSPNERHGMATNMDSMECMMNCASCSCCKSCMECKDPELCKICKEAPKRKDCVKCKK